MSDVTPTMTPLAEPAATVEPKPKAKPTNKPATKPTSKPGAKGKPATKPATKAKPANKPANKPATKAKPANKPADKPATKAKAKANGAATAKRAAKPAKAAPGTFDRIPSGRRPARRKGSSETDMQGKQALFSRAAQPPPVGSAAIECKRCNRRSVVTLVRLAQLSVPGVHIPSTGGGHRALLKCPACEQRSWVKVSLR